MQSTNPSSSKAVLLFQNDLCAAQRVARKESVTLGVPWSAAKSCTRPARQQGRLVAAARRPVHEKSASTNSWNWRCLPTVLIALQSSPTLLSSVLTGTKALCVEAAKALHKVAELSTDYGSPSFASHAVVATRSSSPCPAWRPR